MKRTKEETISWLKAALKRQKDFQEEIKKECTLGDRPHGTFS